MCLAWFPRIHIPNKFRQITITWRVPQGTRMRLPAPTEPLRRRSTEKAASQRRELNPCPLRRAPRSRKGSSAGTPALPGLARPGPALPGPARPRSPPPAPSASAGLARGQRAPRGALAPSTGRARALPRRPQTSARKIN